ncbi:MAG: T9SS type A sorting domain-containing protein [Bacteroidia bacterium]
MFTKSYRFTLLLVLMIIGISQGLRAQTLTFTVATDTAGPGDIVEIPISVSNFLSIQGYQGTIAWDSAALDFVSLVSPTPGISNIFGTPGMGLVPLNAATFTWVDFSGVGKTLSAGTVVMKITFQVKSSASFGVTPVIINSSVTLLGYTTGSGLITPNVNQGSVLVTGCIATADPSFTYPATACQFGANPLANITGDPGGTFTVDQGASINPATGELDLATTLPGTTYQVTYTVGSPCPAVSNRSIHIQPLDDASFTFVDSVCFNSANPAAVVTGLNGGTFFVNNGATINPATGILDLTTTAPGLTYLITYQTQGLCPDFSNQSVYVADTADVSFVYPASVCPGSANPVATITGAVGGIFSVSPSASINPATGELDINSITPGIIYTITYSLSDICQSFSQRQIVVEDTTPPTVICQNITVTLDSTGSSVIDVSMIDAGSADNCGIFSLTLSQDSFGVADIGVQTVTLTVVDNSGNSSSCEATVTVEGTTSISGHITPGLSLSVYPNPVENVLNMQWDSPWQGKVSIVMVNALGQIISTENKIKHSQQMEAELSFGALPSGMYIIQVSQDGYTQHKRVFRK